MLTKVENGLEKVKGSWGSTKAFFSEVVTETKKVTWPTLKEVRDTTIVVIIAVFIFGFFLYLVDLGLAWGLKHIFGTVA